MSAFRLFRRLRDLLDVDFSTFQDGDRVTYRASDDTFVGMAASGGSTAAADVAVTPAGGISATDVQAALEELDTEKASATSFADHSARHENGGADEISVAGLSGLLADSQTPLSHVHAGEDITSGTVADARIASTIARDSEVTSAIAAHEADTTNVHGITDTSALDTVSARNSAIASSEAGQVRDGDAAGGVLAGTYPSPSFAVDMATQAELDAAVATLQPLDSDLTAFAGLAIAADKLPYGSGSHTLALADFTAAARALLDDADAAAMLTTLGFSTFVKTLVDDADAATARATLGVIASLFQSGGAQAIKLDDLATPDDNTDLNASTSRHGLLPKLDGSSAKFLDGSGAFSTPAGGSGLLAVTAYAPGTDTSIGSVASATIGDFDATNLAVTFTAPASGNVVVVLSGLAGPNSGTAQLFYGIRESTTVLAKVLVDGSSNTAGRYYTIPIYLTGLSAGSHTYKFGGAAASGTILIYGGPNWGKVTMQVYAAP